MRNVTNKLGADVIVASKDYEEEMKNSLFMGEPSTITFDKELTSGIENLNGVENISSQLLLSTFFDECCDAEIQFIAFDEESDFIIRTWIKGFNSKLSNNEIIIGNDINYNVGQKAKFYGKIFDVVGKLNKTGMGYDRSIFINTNIGQELLTVINGEEKKNQVSMILLNVNNDYDLNEVTRSINNNISDNKLTAFKSNEMYAEIINGIERIADSLNIFIVIILFISTLSIFSIVTISINQIKREFASMEIMGIRDKIKGLIVWIETVSISAVASIIGSILSINLIYLFRNYIESVFKMPFLMPTTQQFIGYSMQSLLLAVMVASISSFYSTYKVYKTSYNKLKEGI